MSPSTSSPGFAVSPGFRRILMAVAGAGLATLGAGLALAPTRALSSLLTSGFYFLCLGLGGAVFLALMYVANAGWATGFKRIPEAFAAYVPWGAATMLALVPGASALYLWARPGVMETDHLLHTKAAFLNVPFFAVWLVVMLALWVAFTYVLRRNSVRQDTERTAALTARNVTVSAVFLCLFGLTFCLAAFDWLMTRESHWFSTIYGLYNIAGLLSSTVCALTVAAILLSRSGAMPGINESHLHDLGKLMFGFATLWAYLWFSQYLLDLVLEHPRGDRVLHHPRARRVERALLREHRPQLGAAVPPAPAEAGQAQPLAPAARGGDSARGPVVGPPAHGVPGQHARVPGPRRLRGRGLPGPRRAVPAGGDARGGVGVARAARSTRTSRRACTTTPEPSGSGPAGRGPGPAACRTNLSDT